MAHNRFIDVAVMFGSSEMCEVKIIFDFSNLMNQLELCLYQ